MQPQNGFQVFYVRKYLLWGLFDFLWQGTASLRDHLFVSSCTSNVLVLFRGGSEQLKATRTAKSNAELCNELREFNSMAGLPENHVPSMKELCQHGRFMCFLFLPTLTSCSVLLLGIAYMCMM